MGPRIKNNLSPLTRARIRKLPVPIVRNASTYRNLSFDRSTELTSYIYLWGRENSKAASWPVGIPVPRTIKFNVMEIQSNLEERGNFRVKIIASS